MAKRLLTLLCIGATLSLVVLGCEPSYPGPTTTSTSASTSTTFAPGEINCGIDYLASGWPTTTAPTPATFTCILDAFAAGSSAQFIEREQTDGNGGHIRVTTFQIIGVRSVKVTVDSTGAQPRGGVTVESCGALTAPAGAIVLQTGSCTP
jgi:hypothetical protein